MAKSNTNWLGSKLRHIGSNLLSRAGAWGKVGLGIGLAVGVGAVLLTSAPVLATLATATLSWGVTGAVTGGLWGAIKGTLTRPEPNADEIMRDVDNCPPTPGAAPAVAPSLAPGLAQGFAGPAAAAPAPAAKAAPKMAPPPAAMDEIHELSKALGQVEGVSANVKSGSAAAKQPTQENWQKRVAEGQAAQNGPQVR